MNDQYDKIEALIRGLVALQNENRADEALASALPEQPSAQQQLKQVERVLEAYRTMGAGRDDARDLELLINLGRTYDQFAHLDKAMECYRTAGDLAGRLGDVRAQAEVLRRMGKVMLRRRRWDAALELLDQSLEIFRRINDRVGQARVALNRGIALHEQGEFAGAEAAYSEALALAEEAGDNETVADAQSNLAVLASLRGDLDDALARYQSCLARFEALKDETGLARVYHNLGMTLAGQEDWKAAMQYYERAFELAQKAGLLDVVANVYLSRAELLLELGDTSMASSCCALALDIYRETGDLLGEADTYRLLGRVFVKRRQWGTAEVLFQDSIKMNIEYDNPFNVAEAQRDLGQMYAERGQHRKAQEALETAREGFEKMGAQAEVAATDAILRDLDAIPPS